jgi:hypothetical protein
MKKKKGLMISEMKVVYKNSMKSHHSGKRKERKELGWGVSEEENRIC